MSRIIVCVLVATIATAPARAHVNASTTWLKRATLYAQENPLEVVSSVLGSALALGVGFFIYANMLTPPPLQKPELFGDDMGDDWFDPDLDADIRDTQALPCPLRRAVTARLNQPRLFQLVRNLDYAGLEALRESIRIEEFREKDPFTELTLEEVAQVSGGDHMKNFLVQLETYVKEGATLYRDDGLFPFEEELRSQKRRCRDPRSQ